MLSLIHERRRSARLIYTYATRDAHAYTQRRTHARGRAAPVRFGIPISPRAAATSSHLLTARPWRRRRPRRRIGSSTGTRPGPCTATRCGIARPARGCTCERASELPLLSSSARGRTRARARKPYPSMSPNPKEYDSRLRSFLKSVEPERRRRQRARSSRQWGNRRRGGPALHLRHAPAKALTEPPVLLRSGGLP